MMELTDIGLARIFMKNPKRFRSFVLSKRQIKIVQWVKKCGAVDSAELSGRERMSIQNSSLQLYRLYKKGYLARNKAFHETGGVIYIYRLSYA